MCGEVRGGGIGGGPGGVGSRVEGRGGRDCTDRHGASIMLFDNVSIYFFFPATAGQARNRSKVGQTSNPKSAPHGSSHPNSCSVALASHNDACFNVSGGHIVEQTRH